MDISKQMEALSLTDNISESIFSKLACCSIQGIETEIVYGNHSNNILIIASQFKKLGSLLEVTKDKIENFESVAEVVYTVKPISGRENEEEQAAARYIAEQIESDKKLYIFLCLKNYDPETVKAVAYILRTLKNNSK